jgi:hypothetical protein
MWDDAQLSETHIRVKKQEDTISLDDIETQN